MEQSQQADHLSDWVILPIRALKDNYIWALLNKKKQELWVVDPGDAEPVLSFLSQNTYRLTGILLTHHHWDHTNGVERLLAFQSDITVVGAANSIVSQITHRVKEGDEVICSSLPLRVLEIPGHTLDHIAFYTNTFVFTGDTLFSAGCGRVFEGTFAQMHQSLNKLAALPDDIKVYCGHEYTLQNLAFAAHVEKNNEFIQEKIARVKQLIAADGSSLPSTLGEEKKMNPFLRCTRVDVVSAVAAYAKKTLVHSDDVFEYLRRWKDEAGSSLFY